MSKVEGTKGKLTNGVNKALSYCGLNIQVEIYSAVHMHVFLFWL